MVKEGVDHLEHCVRQVRGADLRTGQLALGQGEWSLVLNNSDFHGVAGNRSLSSVNLRMSARR